ncbi:phage tail protein [Lapidilactobacillus wuchangensis]|uniref:phage tail protein n=1 Tax=Lapidilactobacillus wuchangensis TaxID=2486001 RepID=UPI000F7ABD11|nr:phage tail protein [Lapidilactobacillus wuchangensis]
MADEFASSIEEWMNQVDFAITLTNEDKAKITGAGAEAFTEVLKKNTPRSDVNYNAKGKSAGHANAKHGNSHRKKQHLADSITYKSGHTADNLATGDTDVGYSEHYYDFLARIINNGKKKMSPKEMANMYYSDKSQQEAQKPVEEAMLKAYKEVRGQ